MRVERINSPENTYKSTVRDKWLCKTNGSWVLVNNIGCDTSCGAFAYANDLSICPERIDPINWRVNENDQWVKRKDLYFFRFIRLRTFLHY